MNIMTLDIADFLFSFPSVLIFIGILSALHSSRKTVGLLLILFGSAMHVSRYYNIDFGEFMLPLIFIAVGFLILIKHNKPKPFGDFHKYKFQQEVKDDFLESISIFSGSNKFFVSDAFKGGNITSIFGGSEINLTDCKLADGENIIDVVAIFGGTKIFVPKDWNVVIDVFPIFGGFEAKGIRNPQQVLDKSKVLKIKGVVIFGGGQIVLV